MKVLELFAGSRSIGKASEELGHEVFSSDINDFEGIDYVGDIRDFQVSDCPFVPDVIWASPPCTGFSVAAIGRNWVKGEIFTPKTESARLGVEILNATLDLITEFIKINPEVIWFVENPRGKMRKSPRLKEISHFMIRRTVTYCQYGDERMKPTDIWTNNFYWKPRPACKNGDPCHVAAPRGSQTGTQGLKGNYERSKIPHELCLEVVRSSFTLEDSIWSIKDTKDNIVKILKEDAKESDIMEAIEHFNTCNLEWYIYEEIDESEDGKFWILKGNGGF